MVFSSEYKFGDPIGDLSKPYDKIILGMPVEFEYFDVQNLGHPIMQMGGFFLFDWLKKIFASPVTRGIVNVAKKVAPVLEKAALGEIGKTEKGKEIADVYGKAKTFGSRLYDVGKDVYGAVKGSGDPAYKMAQIIEEAYAKKGSGLNIAGGKTINPKDTERLVTGVYVPQLISNLKQKGVKLRKKYTPGKKKTLKNRIRKSLKKQKGGFWQALLPLLPSLIPIASQMAEHIVPLLSNLFSPGKMGSGAFAGGELNAAVGEELAGLLQKYMESEGQLGSGFFDTLKDIGSTVMNAIKEIFPVVKNIFQKVMPVLEPTVLTELGKTKKGQQISDIYSRGKAIGTKGYNIGKDIYSAFQ